MTTQEDVEFLHKQLDELSVRYAEAQTVIDGYRSRTQAALGFLSRLEALVHTLTEESGDLVQVVAQIRATLSEPQSG